MENNGTFGFSPVIYEFLFYFRTDFSILISDLGENVI